MVTALNRPQCAAVPQSAFTAVPNGCIELLMQELRGSVLCLGKQGLPGNGPALSITPCSNPRRLTRILRSYARKLPATDLPQFALTQPGSGVLFATCADPEFLCVRSSAFLLGQHFQMSKPMKQDVRSSTAPGKSIW